MIAPVSREEPAGFSRGGRRDTHGVDDGAGSGVTFGEVVGDGVADDSAPGDDYFGVGHHGANPVWCHTL